MNAYGPAECSVVSTIQPNAATALHASNIGRPISSACWVVSPHDPERPVPIGTVGELLIEGPSVARGYIHDLERTVASFVPSPTWLRAIRSIETLSNRVYLTGDLVRYESDGSLSYCGRKDAEFKIRGQRVHMGEVENQVQVTFPQVQDVMVDVVSLRNKRQSMVAFLRVAVDSHKTTGDDLLLPPSIQNCTGWSEARLKLEEVLPDYMVPTFFLPVTDIPQTTTGKIDRSRLRQVAESLSTEELQAYSGLSEFKRPVSTAAERLIQTTWAEVLGFEQNQIGSDDSFFRLGGDSITAMQASNRARALGVIHSVADLLRWKTVAQVAANARYIPAHNDNDVPVDSRDSFSLTPYQRSILGQRNPQNVDIRVQLTQRLPVDKIQAAIAIVVRRHPMLRARFRRNAQGAWEQSISPVGKNADYFCTHEHEEKVNQEALSILAQQKTSITNGPVFRVDVFEDLTGCQELHIAAHPMVIDWTSLQIICRDLEKLLYDDYGICPDASGPGFREWCAQQYQTQKEKADVRTEGQCRPDETPSGVPASMPEKPLVSDEFTLTQQVTEDLHSIATCMGLSLQTVLMASVHCSIARVSPTIPLPTIIANQETRQFRLQSEQIGPFCARYAVPPPPVGCDDLLGSLRRCEDAFSLGEIDFSFGTATDREIAEVHFTYKRQVSTDGRLCLIEDASPRGLSDGSELPASAIYIDVTDTANKLHFHAFGRNSEKVRCWLASLKDYILHTLPTSSIARRKVFVSNDFPLLKLTYPELDMLLDHHIPSKGLKLDRVETIYPCSPTQKGLLFVQERDAICFSASAVWKIHSSTERKGQADATKLQEAWKQVVSRHESLRSVFIRVDNLDYASQVILTSGSVSVDRVFCEEPAPGEIPRALSTEPLQQLTSAQIMHNFTICETDSDGLFARLDVSQTIVDGVSMAIIERDLRLAYDGLLDANQPTAYRDCVSHLQQLDIHSNREAENYWKEYLNDYSPFNLPSDAMGSFHSTSKSSFQSVSVRMTSDAQLRRFCAKLDITMSTFFYFAWAVVLWRFTGSSDICFGSFTAGRDANVPGIQDAVGLFANVLACRVSVDKDDTFANVLPTVQKNHSNGLSHALPLAKIAQLAALPTEDLIRTVVNVQFSTISHSDTNSSLELTRVSSEEYTEQDITLCVDSIPAGLEVALNYRSSKVSDFLAAQMADYLDLIISTILLRPHGTPRELVRVLSTNDQTMLGHWSSSITESDPKCLHPIIHRWSQDQPHALAVAETDETLTYKELDLFSSELAQRISAVGIRPRTFIPLYFEKSRWVIVAVLAVIKAGCAFILLDPSHPFDRLQFICSETHASLILCSKKLASTGAALATNSLVVSGDEFSKIDDKVDYSPPSMSPDDPLYMVFTSGSTGRPKGAIVHHNGFVSSNTALIRPFGLDSTSTVLHFCSYSFDVSVQEILLTLMVGATIRILSDAEREHFLLRGYSPLPVTHTILTPSVASILDPTRASTWVSTMILIGEPISRSFVQRWAGVVRLINSYGPAECSVTSHCTEALTEVCDPVNIGRANGAFGWVTDPNDPSILAPIGAVGELILDGPAVGRGYYNEPEKTAAAFIPPPSWSVERPDLGSRCYRTGDLVRYESDGTLRFEGRQGTQAKLRGQRVELGEIEYQIKEYFPGTTGAVAEVVTLAGGVAHIVAFITLDKTGTTNPTPEQTLLLAPETEFFQAQSSAISRLECVLPTFMIPSYFLPLRSFPQTMSNKTDRRQLRELVLTMSDSAITAYSGLKAHREPSNEREEAFRQILAQTLGVEPTVIGIDDDFFQLGGDSVAAMKIASTARAAGFHITGPDILIQRRISRMVA
ncbi:acetyl-CoA synthetase-like protein [Penicillium capsulatum]|uniref:Acetyl-CoA synthetase-like protein n=1 Tax=Penicillium capsulatum TaxID=69766 RepID=A0A9W9ILH5_9EURO|nr:acetyl-CoA synthetase-like protein [Penicillium capsulatum]